MSAFQGSAVTETQVKEFFDILSIMRPHGSRMEQRFIDKYLTPLKPQVDECGNHILRIGKEPIMWSCHIDTVHNWGGIAPLLLDKDGIIKVHPKSQANCLGADDGTGVWIMLQMIKAERPGLYIFHRGEERGGIGSRHISTKTPHVVRGIKAAIAFDRKDTGSIITHQWGGRCCSDEFAHSLADAIGLDMKTDTGGSFTDTACYTDLVGECTNVSVGYKWQHSKSEEQDLAFAILLLDRMLEFDSSKLVYKRKAGEKEKRTYTSYYRGGRSSNGYSNYTAEYWKDPKLKFENGKEWDNKVGGYLWPESSGKVWDEDKKEWVVKDKKDRDKTDKWTIHRRITKVEPNTHGGTTTTFTYEPETYMKLLRDFPEEIAAILEAKGFGLAYLHQQIRTHGGKVETVYIGADGKVQGTAGETSREENKGS